MVFPIDMNFVDGSKLPELPDTDFHCPTCQAGWNKEDKWCPNCYQFSLIKDEKGANLKLESPWLTTDIEKSLKCKVVKRFRTREALHEAWQEANTTRMSRCPKCKLLTTVGEKCVRCKTLNDK